MRPWVLAIVLLLPAFVGCLGGDEDSNEDVVRQRAEVTGELGGIEGVVTDPAIQPIEGATVLLVETNETVETAQDGSYAFSRVEPGTYTIQVRAEGFVPDEQTVQVRTGRAAVVDFIISHGAIQEAYTQELEMAGFVECGIGWRQDLADMPTVLLEDSAFAACAVPNLQLGGNATNDRFLHTFELEAPIATVVYELDWPSGGPAVADPALRTIMEIDGFINQNGSRLMDTRGGSPIVVRMDEPVWEQMDQNFTDRCEGLNGSEANDAWCGFNFWDNGWPLVLRVFATGDCADTPVAACLVFQQEFTHYVSAFYNEPAPSGYQITG